MKILFIHNSYSDITPSGEEHACRELERLLQEKGHEVRVFSRSSDEIRNNKLGKFKAFFTGIYNPFSARDLAQFLDSFKPDIVQVQNIYPLLSSSIFKPIHDRNIPIVMRCPNYRLFCPSGLCLSSKGEICEKCFGGKEWNCLINNCEQNLLKSLGYSLRNYYTRITKSVTNNVNAFIVQSEFQKNIFIELGIKSDKIVILPGICPEIGDVDSNQLGEYVSFVGRISPEKGIYEFIESAKINPGVPFKIAGIFDKKFVMPNNIPENIEFVGFKTGEALNDFYIKSRIIVVPSKWYEGFPNVITRGMLLKRPIITTNIGAMPSIITDKKHGLLVEPGNSVQLGETIKYLYSNQKLCIEYGEAGYQKAKLMYSRDSIYNILLSCYKAII